MNESKIIYRPKIYLTKQENNYDILNSYPKPVIMFGVIGSTPQKSMPYEYIAKLVDFVTTKFNVSILFNYAPNQKEDAIDIYNMCQNKTDIILDIYEPSIRGFVKLMNKCSLLIANEGGTVHIAKALNKPTFTIFSPYVLKEHWASFEDGITHQSIHLREEKPELYDKLSYNNRKKIEHDPNAHYKELTPDIIIPKLDVFLNQNLNTKKH